MFAKVSESSKLSHPRGKTDAWKKCKFLPSKTVYLPLITLCPLFFVWLYMQVLFCVIVVYSDTEFEPQCYQSQWCIKSLCFHMLAFLSVNLSNAFSVVLLTSAILHFESCLQILGQNKFFQKCWHETSVNKNCYTQSGWASVDRQGGCCSIYDLLTLRLTPLLLDHLKLLTRLSPYHMMQAHTPF